MEVTYQLVIARLWERGLLNSGEQVVISPNAGIIAASCPSTGLKKVFVVQNFLRHEHPGLKIDSETGEEVFVVFLKDFLDCFVYKLGNRTEF
jgi:hypothetical protein